MAKDFTLIVNGEETQYADVRNTDLPLDTKDKNGRMAELSEVTAAAGDVAKGYRIYDASGNIITGTSVRHVIDGNGAGGAGEIVSGSGEPVTVVDDDDYDPSITVDEALINTPEWLENEHKRACWKMIQYSFAPENVGRVFHYIPDDESTQTFNCHFKHNKLYYLKEGFVY